MSKRQSPPYEVLSVSRHIHPLVHDGGMVLLDSETGQRQILNRQGSALLEAVNTEGNFDAVYNYFQRVSPQHTPEQVAANAARWVKEMVRMGLVSEQQAQPRKFAYNNSFSEEEQLGAGEVLMSRNEVDETRFSAAEKRAAASSLTLATTVIQLSFKEMVSYVREARADAERDATDEEVKRDLLSLHCVSERFLGRIACLEMSIAAALHSAQSGKRTEVALGARVDPIAFHAWPVAGDMPVRLETDEQITGVYHTLFKI